MINLPVNSFDNYPMSWKPKRDKLETPVYKSLAELMESDIRSGKLNPGDKLPPQRELADYLDLNLSTITRAFKLCEMKGLINGTIGKGTYISYNIQSSPLLLSTLNDDYIDMGAAFPIYDQNKYIIDIIKKNLKKDKVLSLLEYAPTEGTLSHRKTAVKYLKRFNIDTKPDNILIASGAQNALSAILISLFNAGDKIGTDSLTYPAFKTLANTLGIRLVPLPLREPSVSSNTLNSLIKNEGIKGIYLIPEMHNPTACSMKETQKRKVADLIIRNNLILIEDGIYAYSSEKNSIPVSTFAKDNSIYISSVSKSICAGLRVAFLNVSNKYLNKVKEGIYNINISSPALNVEIACEVIESGLCDKIIAERLKTANERNSIVDETLKHRIILGNKNSLFRWLILPEFINCDLFEKEALKKGVQIFCAQKFVVGNADFKPAARLSVCTPKNKLELKQALIIIDNLICDYEKKYGNRE